MLYIYQGVQLLWTEFWVTFCSISNAHLQMYLRQLIADNQQNGWASSDDESVEDVVRLQCHLDANVREPLFDEDRNARDGDVSRLQRAVPPQPADFGKRQPHHMTVTDDAANEAVEAPMDVPVDAPVDAEQQIEFLPNLLRVHLSEKKNYLRADVGHDQTVTSGWWRDLGGLGGGLVH